MTELSHEFETAKAGRVNFRSLCTAKADPRTGHFEGIYAAAVQTGTGEATDALPFAVILWDKETDLFGVTFPEDGEHMLHRLHAHFYNGNLKPTPDSSAFKPLSEVLEHLPQLKDKNITTSQRGTDRIINNLTHAQLETVIECASSLNHGLKQIADYRKAMDAHIQLQADNAFTSKPAAAPEKAGKEHPRRKKSAPGKTA